MKGMKQIKFLILLSVLIVISSLFFHSCEDFMNPEQDLVIREDDYFKEWRDYRSAEMGLYSLQQQLVEQLVVLGELRGDLLTVTPNATKDLIEICNFESTANNQYTDPRNFYKLIAACNNLIRKLEEFHPEVMEPGQSLTNFDYLYGEVRCMRAWAYFNAVRIYGEIPYAPVSLTSIDEIDEYIRNGGHFVDSVDVVFPANGLPTKEDTLVTEPINYEGYAWLDMNAVIDMFTKDLEEKVTVVGVNHWIGNGDRTWDATVWNEFAKYSLLGQMYLHQGDYTMAVRNFNEITELIEIDTDNPNIRYGLDNAFAENRWRNIFTGINLNEHILSLPFDKSNQQQHDLQLYFSIQPPNKYYLKPTFSAVYLWETIWMKYNLTRDDANPEDTEFKDDPRFDNDIRGVPGDFHRGQGVSYAYIRKGATEPMKNTSFDVNEETVERMLEYKMDSKEQEYLAMMREVDTVVYKYSIGKLAFDRDAFFTIYRAASIHLYMAEIHARWQDYSASGLIRNYVPAAQEYLNNGQYRNNTNQLGVRGRVGERRYGGFGGKGLEEWRVFVENDIIYRHDPFTNELIFPPLNLKNDLVGKQHYLVDKIMEERARELAFEGERFYDLMRVARRRSQPEYLAMRVASKFSNPSTVTKIDQELLSGQVSKQKYDELYQTYLADTEAGSIYLKLLDESNWYIDFKWLIDDEESDSND